MYCASFIIIIIFNITNKCTIDPLNAELNPICHLLALLVHHILYVSRVGVNIIYKTKLNSVALVRERTIPTERPPPVGEVSANFCG